MKAKIDNRFHEVTMDVKELISDLEEYKSRTAKCSECVFHKITGDPYDYWACGRDECIFKQVIKALESMDI